MYHTSGDVIGALIARVSGRSFGMFLCERIFDPLEMKDTGFHVPAGKVHRLPSFYFFNPKTNKLDFFDDPSSSAWASEPPSESGGGLVSTVDDYFTFSRMILNKGRHGTEQIISRASVELMTSNQLTPEQRAGAETFFGTHSGWGLGMAVDIARGALSQPWPVRLDGRFRHDGVHRPGADNDRDSLHAADYGLAAGAQSFH